MPQPSGGDAARRTPLQAHVLAVFRHPSGRNLPMAEAVHAHLPWHKSTSLPWSLTWTVDETQIAALNGIDSIKNNAPVAGTDDQTS